MKHRKLNVSGVPQITMFMSLSTIENDPKYQKQKYLPWEKRQFKTIKELKNPLINISKRIWEDILSIKWGLMWLEKKRQSTKNYS